MSDVVSTLLAVTFGYVVGAATTRWFYKAAIDEILRLADEERGNAGR